MIKHSLFESFVPLDYEYVSGLRMQTKSVASCSKSLLKCLG